MQYVSTRNNNDRVDAQDAIIRGLAPDGGLYVPRVLPRMPKSALTTLSDMSYIQRAAYIMTPFLPAFSPAEMFRFVNEAYGPERFDTPAVAPLRELGEHVFALELWHGPTCAFKDLALQMLPHLITASLKKKTEDRTLCILVATSGDTGKAALEGFRDVAGTKILVFYPKDGVSEVQKLQMVTQAGDNVGVCAVEGNFDDTQNGVKRIFSDRDFGETLARKGLLLSSANSINWGRVLPQLVYYISAYCDLCARGAIETGEKINICVPTGNFGNILAACYAGQMGLPINRLICASNENHVLTDFIQTGVYDRNRPFHRTVSPSMDILISSNLERLLYLLSGGEEELVRGCMGCLDRTGRYELSEELLGKLRSQFWGGYCDDARTALAIARCWNEEGYLIDTHTAVAMDVLAQYRRETGDAAPCVVASTASPFKFSQSALRALGEQDAPEGFAAIDRLSELTGVTPPPPLKNLRGLTPRFSECVERDGMYGAVERLLL